MSGQYLPMKSWAEDERPREKLLQKGVAALSTNELLAILLRSGVDGESALDVARRILADYDNDLNTLARVGIRELVNKYKGVGIAKACSIIAAMEIGRRRKPETAKVSPVIRSSSDVFHYINPYIGDVDHEEFWVIYLSQSSRINGCERLSSGGISGTIVDVRMIFRKALDMKASFIVITHNHPTGRLEPSSYDMTITKKIKAGGELLDIILYDHVIVGNGSWFSFVDAGILESI